MGHLKSCKYCGRIHDSRIRCAKAQRVYATRESEADRFRNTHAWQCKREEIRQRDYNLCRACLARGVLTYEGLSVHHIWPLEHYYARRLDDANLITLCDADHELAEAGAIPAAALERLAASPPALPSSFFQVHNTTSGSLGRSDSLMGENDEAVN